MRKRFFVFIFSIILTFAFTTMGVYAQGGYNSNSYPDETVICNEDPIRTSPSVEAAAVGDRVILGGGHFGVRLLCDGVIISQVSSVDTENGNVSPGNTAGLKAGDVITEINNIKVSGIDNVLASVKGSEGKGINIKFTRGTKEYDTELNPAYSVSEKEYMIGLWLKDQTAGIGTLTYIDPMNGTFAGLGHGICDQNTGMLLPMRDGRCSNVVINGIVRGEKGTPGELRGIFDNETGTLTANTIRGVFGKMSENTFGNCTREAEIGSKEDIQEGPASILCALGDENISEYGISIKKIDKSSGDTKNFVIKVTDDKLLKKTGGIVQGMSGSPVIQNGKLVGAITHVLVDDPQCGFGIFIENMLESADNGIN